MKKGLGFRVICVMILFPNIRADASETGGVIRAIGNRSSIFGEFGGTGGVNSVNYEYFINNGLVSRIGLSGLRQKVLDDDFYTRDKKVIYVTWRTNTVLLPITISKLIGEENSRSKIELGVGVLESINFRRYSREDNTDFPAISNTFYETAFTGIFGYRYQPPVEGILFRIIYSPRIFFSSSRYDFIYLSGTDDSREFGYGPIWNEWVWFGFSLGYTY